MQALEGAHQRAEVGNILAGREKREGSDALHEIADWQVERESSRINRDLVVLKNYDEIVSVVMAEVKLLSEYGEIDDGRKEDLDHRRGEDVSGWLREVTGKGFVEASARGDADNRFLGRDIGIGELDTAIAEKTDLKVLRQSVAAEAELRHVDPGHDESPGG